VQLPRVQAADSPHATGPLIAKTSVRKVAPPQVAAALLPATVPALSGEDYSSHDELTIFKQLKISYCFYYNVRDFCLINLTIQQANQTMDNIGARLKTIRTHQGLSQRRLARKSGVSNATISLIEHGRTDPSMGMLRRILEAMGISFAEFFSSDSRPSDKFFYNSSELSDISSGAISYRQVGSDLRDSQLQLMHERYAPGADTGRSMLSHDAEEGGIVLKGRLEITVGDQVRVLSAGDAYLFNSRLPHRFRNTGQEDCILVSACTPPTF